MQSRILKKGQIGMIETILVLIVVFVLIASVMILYFKFSNKSIEETSEELIMEGSSVFLESIVSMPEVQCSTRGIEKNCVDVLKLYSLRDNIGKNYRSYYTEVFGYKTIKVIQLYPVPKEGECTMFDYQNVDFISNCNTWTIYESVKKGYKSKNIISTPVSLYFPDSGIYSIGKLQIEVYL